MKKDIYIHHERMHSDDSPREIVPILVDIVQPASVVDVGCGTGNFLKVFKASGVNEVFGLDGSWVDINKLKKNINPETEFRNVDLQKPVSLARKFDLAISLEVAEHLHPDAADTFLDNLTGLSDVIVFSAAIPNQGGQNHINEQQVTYWEQKFRERGYVFYDVLRPYFWENENVFCWYKQNMALYVRKEVQLPQGVMEKYRGFAIKNYVHPELFNIKTDQLNRIVYGEYTIYGYLKLLIKGILRKLRLLSKEDLKKKEVYL